MEANWSWSNRQARLEWESYKDGKFQNHLNFKTRMQFVAIHDPETFVKRFFALTDKDLIEWAKKYLPEEQNF